MYSTLTQRKDLYTTELKIRESLSFGYKTPRHTFEYFEIGWEIILFCPKSSLQCVTLYGTISQTSSTITDSSETRSYYMEEIVFF